VVPVLRWLALGTAVLVVPEAAADDVNGGYAMVRKRAGATA